jgi:hypothetical protein
VPHAARDSPSPFPSHPLQLQQQQQQLNQSREHLPLRGRALTAVALPSNSRPNTPQAAIPKPPSAAAHDASALERKPSTSGSYGHHRQASVVHGNIQHSRNPSFASPTSAHPPNSAPKPADLASPRDVMDPRTMASAELSASAGAKKGHSPSASGAVGELPPHFAPRRLERVHSTSGRARNGGHTPSHSRTHHSESRTVGEYALHHLFNAVSLARRWGSSDCASSLP